MCTVLPTLKSLVSYLALIGMFVKYIRQSYANGWWYRRWNATKSYNGGSCEET